MTPTEPYKDDAQAEHDAAMLIEAYLLAAIGFVFLFFWALL